MQATCGWAVSIEAELARVGQAQAGKDAKNKYNTPRMFRIPPYIRTLKPGAYDPQALSFGLYNRDFKNMSSMDKDMLHIHHIFRSEFRIIQSVLDQTGFRHNRNTVYNDMWLFENQVSLFMIRNVWNQVQEDRSDEETSLPSPDSLFDAHLQHMHKDL